MMLVGLPSMANVGNVSAFVPLNDGDPVSTWTDSSGSGNDATNTGGARPTFETGVVNSKPVVRYASGQQLNLAGFSALNPWESIAVWQPASGVDVSVLRAGSNTATTAFFRNDGYFIVGANTALGYYAGSPSASFRIYSVKTDPIGSAAPLVWLDGSSVGMTPFGSASGSTFTTLGSPSMDIAEVVHYNVHISDTDRANVEKYLGTKYAITVAGGTAANPDTVSGLIGWWKADSLG